MKKAIFLVDDIKDGKIYTLLEAAYNKVNEKLKEEGNGYLHWLSEISILLNNHPSDFIKFEKASDFIKHDKLPEDRDVFYFISCYHQLDFFPVTNFLLMDPNVSDFLVKHKVPVIIDSSMEIVDHYDASRRLLENFMFSNPGHSSQSTQHYRNLCSLEFYIVGSMYSHVNNDSINIKRNVKTYHSIFPGPFFQYNGRGLSFNMDVSLNRDTRINEVNTRKITDNTLVWQAFSNKTRLNRGLFILKAEHEGLGSVGKYSRILPGKDDFIREYNACSMDRESSRLAFITPESLDSLNNLRYIDGTISGPTTFDNSDCLLHVSLETFAANYYRNILHSSSFLTEKTAMAIGSACPFIPMGGHKIGEQLNQAGFREYTKLEFPCQPHLLDELDYIIDRLKEIASLSLIEKQKLYDSWKDTIVHNYDRYLNIDIKKYYLEILNTSRHQGIAVT